MDLTTESETPPRSQPIINPLSFSCSTANGSLLKNHHHHHPLPPSSSSASPPPVYRECLKNHAASIGGHAVDGCGEFMPSPTATPSQPTSLKCAACGCHRNFHRRELPDHPGTIPPTHFLDFHRPHPHPHPVAVLRSNSASPSGSPPPPPSNYAASHVLLSLAAEDHHHHHKQQQHHHHGAVATPGTPTAEKMENPPHTGGRKRFRTKFSQEQKEKMSGFAEKLGWKLQRCDEGMVEEFCRQIGIRRGILKVWMHNNKNTFGKKEKSNGGRVIRFGNGGDGGGDGGKNGGDHQNGGGGGGVHLQASTNGSSSSS